MKLDGTVAFVLGGARGIGKAYCVSLLEHHAKVCCADLLEDLGRETEKELREKFGAENFVFRLCNGANDAQIRECLQFTKTKFGRLDIVVNNVGILDETNWAKVLDINFGTCIRVTNAALEMLGKDKGGAGGVVVHTSSNGGVLPQFYCPVYCATKAAMVHYVRSWAHQFNYQFHGVRMFTICPRMTDTEFVMQNDDPTKVLHLEILKSFVKPDDKSIMLKTRDLGEALIKGLLDDTANGVALQLLTPEPEFLFRDQTNQCTMKEVTDNKK